MGYDFFTNENVALRFYIVIIAQYIFNTVGWFFSSALWNLFRGEAISRDPNFTGLLNFVLSDQTMVGNLGIGTGYAIFGYLVWFTLSQLGMPITAQKRTDSVPTKNTLEDIVKFGPSIDTLTDKTSSEINSVDDMIELLDGVLSVFPAMRATLINTVLSTAFILFWTVMRALPDRTNNKKRIRRSLRDISSK